MESALSCAINSALGVEVVSFDPDTNTYCIRAPPGCASTDLEKVYMRLPEVKFAVAAGKRCAHVGDPASVKVSYQPVQWARIYVKYDASATADEIARINERFGAVLENMVVAGLYKVRIPVKYTDRMAAGAYARLFETVPKVSYAVYNSYYTPPANCTNGVDPQGLVTDLATGLPIESALVEARMDYGGGNWYTYGSGATATDGTYDFMVPAGEYKLVCSREGYRTEERMVTVVEGEVLVADFSLAPLAVVSGLVTGPGAQPISGAVLKASLGGVVRYVASCAPDGTYYFFAEPGDYVVTCSSPGFTPSSAILTVTGSDDETLDFILTPDATAPVPPENLLAAQDAAGVALTWDAVPDVDLACYRVYRSADAGGPWTSIGQAIACGFLDARIMAGATYYYRVTALDAAQNESAPSQEVLIAVVDMAPPIGMPDWPILAAVVPSQARLFNILFDETGVTQATFQYFDTATASWVDITTDAEIQCIPVPYSVGGRQYPCMWWIFAPWDTSALVQGASYPVRLVATDGSNSTEIPMTTCVIDHSAPTGTAPPPLAFAEPGKNLIVIEPLQGDQALYTIYRSTDPEGTYISLSIVFGSYCVADTSVEPGVTYYYKAGRLDFDFRASGLSQWASATALAEDGAPSVTRIGSGQTSIGSSALVAVSAFGAVSSITLEGSFDGVGWTLLGVCSNPTYDASSQMFMGQFVLDNSANSASMVWLRARALDASGSGGELIASFIIERGPPASPCDLAVLPAEGGAVLYWRRAPGTEGYSVRVYRSLIPAGPRTLVGDYLTADSFTDSGLEPSTTYYYTVTCLDYMGNESATCAPMAVVPSADTTLPMIAGLNPQALSGITKLTIMAMDAGGIRAIRLLRFDGSDWVSVFECASPLFDRYSGVYVAQGIWDVSGMPEGPVQVRLEADDLAGNTASMETSLLIDRTAPDAPADLVATASLGYISLAWSPSASGDVVRYDVYRSDSQSGPYRLIGSDYGSLAFMDPVHEPVSTYYYHVVAIDSAGNTSAATETSALTVPDTQLPTIDQLSASYSPDLPGFLIIGVYASDDVGVTPERLEYSEDGGATWNPIGYVLGSGSYKWDGGHLTDAQVLIRATAVDAWGNEASGEISASVDRTAPEPPTDLAAQVTGENVALTWTASVSGDVVRYRVYRSSSPGGPYQLVTETWSTTYEEYLPEGVVYYYVVAGIDEAYNETRSTEVAASRGDGQPPVILAISPSEGTILDGIVILGATATDNTSVCAIAFHYFDGSAWVQIASVTPTYQEGVGWTAQATWDSGCAPGQSVTIRVTASDPFGASSSAERVYQVADTFPPEAPEGLEALSTMTEILLTWQPVPDVDLDHYAVYRSLVSGGPYELIGTCAQESYTDSSAAPEALYFYVVTAMDTSGRESGHSDEASASLFIPPQPPGSLTAHGLHHAIELYWTASASPTVSYYLVYRSTVTGGPYELVADHVLACSWVDGGLEPGTEFYYVVIAVTDGGAESVSSNEASSAALEGNAPPYVISISPDDNSTLAGVVHFTVFITDDDVVGDVAFRYSPDGAVWTLIALVTASWDEVNARFEAAADWDTGLVTDGFYLVAAFATDSSGMTGSSYGTYQVENLVAPPGPPEPPSQVLVYVQEGMARKLLVYAQPSPSPWATSYNVYRRLPGGAFEFMGSMIPIEQYFCYLDTEVEAGQTYEYMVRAAGPDDVEGGDSQIATAVALADEDTPVLGDVSPLSLNKLFEAARLSVTATDQGTIDAFTWEYFDAWSGAWVAIGTFGLANPYASDPVLGPHYALLRNLQGTFSCEATWDTTGVEPGSYEVRVSVGDQDGHVGTRTYAVSVVGADPADVTAPSLVAIYSPNQYNPAGIRSYIFTRAADETGVILFRYYWSADGMAWTPVGSAVAQQDGDYWDGQIYPWDTSALPEGAVWFRAVAIDTGGNETSSEILVVIDHTPPGAPGGFTATPAEGKVVLSWSPPGDADLAWYRIMRGTSESGLFITISDGVHATTFEDVEALQGQVNFYHVVAVDKAHNEGPYASAFAIPLVDVTPPVIQSVSPPDGSVVGLSVNLEARASDNGRIDTFSFDYFDSTQGEWVHIGTDDAWYRSYDQTWSGDWYWSTAGLDSGAVSLRVTATDGCGNQAMSQWTLLVDHEAPSAPENLAAAAGIMVAILTWDPVSDPDLYTYRVYRAEVTGGPYLVVNWWASDTDWLDNTLEVPGTYYYLVTAVDAVGNESPYSNEASVTVLPDEPPVFLELSLESSTGLRGTVHVYARATDDVRVSYFTLGYSVDGADWTEAASSSAYSGGSYWYCNIYWDTPAVPDGVYLVEIKAFDSRGQSSGITRTDIEIDNTAPPAPAEITLTPIERAIILSWSPVDTADLARYSVYRSTDGGATFWLLANLDAPQTTLTHGSLDPETVYYYYVTCTDEIGNQGASSQIVSAQPFADLTPPVLTAFDLEDGSLHASPVSISLAASDNYGVARITLEYSVDGAQWTLIGEVPGGSGTLTWESAGLPSGQYLVRAFATDVYDLVSESVTRTIALDNTPPPIPEDLAALSGERVVILTWSAVDAGDLAGYRVYRSGEPGSGYILIASCAPGATGFEDRSGELDTRFYYVVAAFDALGNESEASVEASGVLISDTTPPVMECINPGEGSLTRSPVPITITARDNVEVAFITISYSTDGTTFTDIGQVAGASGSLTWDSGALASGCYILRAAATDAVGLVSAALTVAVTLDNDPPAAPVLFALEGQVVLTLYWQAGSETDLAGYRLYRSADPLSGFELLKETTSTFFTDRDVVPLATYFYRLASIDRAGNESVPGEVVSATPQLDTTPPFIQVVTPADGTRVNGVVTITVRASDNVLVDLFNFYRFNGTEFELFASAVPAVEVTPGVWEASAGLDTSELAEGAVSLRVEAVDYGSNVSFLDFVLITDRAPPAAPADIVVLDPETGGRLLLSWDASTESDLAGYRLYRAIDPAGPFTLVTSLLASNAFEDSTLENGTVYYYRVTAVDVAGNESEASATSSGTPSALCDVALTGISFAPVNPVVGRVSTIYVSVHNAGPAPASFTVGIYLGEPLTGTLIGQVNVSLAAGASSLLPVAWTPEANGTVTISAVVLSSSVTDTDPGNDLAVVTADVTLAPVAEAGEDLAVDLWQVVDFDATGSYDTDGQIVSWSWDFGDGSTLAAAQAEHTFNAPGLYTVTLRVTDDAGAVSTDTLTVAVREIRPDLSIEELIWDPVTPDEGQLVTVTVRVTNQGVNPTTKGFLVGFYLNGTYLGYARVDALVAVGQTVDVTYLWTAAPGAHLLKAVADDLLENIDESNETNNSFEAPIATTQVYFPDLELVDLTWSPARTAWSSEEMVSFAAGVVNNGDAEASSFYVSFYLDGEFLGSAYVETLAPGQSLRVSIWASPRPGNRTLEARADGTGRVSESNEANNVASLALPAFTLDYPDLAVVSLTWLPGEIEVSWGASCELIASILNDSGSDVLHAFNVTFFVDGTPVGRERVFGLAAGASLNTRAYWQAGAGPHALRVVVDEQDEVLESNGSNNACETSIPPLRIVYPDFYLSDVSFQPAEVRYGELVTFSATLSNASVVGCLREVTVGLLVDGQLVATARVDSLQGYSSRTVVIAWRALVPTSVAHTFALVADPSNALPEEDESNNAFDLGTLVVLDNLVVELEPYVDYYVNGETSDLAARVTYASSPGFTLTPDYGVVCYMTIHHRDGGVWVERAQMSFDAAEGLYHYLFTPGNTGYAEFTFTLDAETPEYAVSVPGEFNYIDDIIATVACDKLVYERGSVIHVTGRFTFLDGTPISNKIVSLLFERGMMPVSSKNTGTDEDGYFSYDYLPPAGLAGRFMLVAEVFFGAMPFGAYTEFEVLGLLLTPASLFLTGVKTQMILYELVLSNVGDSALSDLAFALNDLDLSDDITATLDASGVPAVLQPGASHRIALLIMSASELSPSAADFTVRVTASGGEAEASIIQVRLADPVPLPVADPLMLKVALRPGMSLLREVRITNQGHATLHGLSLDSSTLVPWITPVGELAGDLPPGGVASLLFIFAPPEGTVLGTYQALLTVTGAEASLSFGISCEVTNSERGSLFFLVENDMGSSLPDAHVTLTGRKPMTHVRDGGEVSSYFTVINAATDAQGRVLIEDVPVDTYDFTVTAAHHESVFGVAEVLPLSEPEIIPVMLTCSPVSWVWTVVPVTITDTYHITLDISYLAEFDKPALLGTPPWILVAHQVTTDIYDRLVVMNPSSVAISEVTLSVVGFSGLVLGTSYLGTIEAGAAQSLPYKIMAGQYGDLDPETSYLLVKGTFLTYDAEESKWVEHTVELRIPIGHPSEQMIYFHAEDGWMEVMLPEFEQFPGLPRVENPLTALVKIRISQQATLEREAFQATLTLTNPTALALEGLYLEVRVRDESGLDVTDMFYPVPPELAGLSSIDGDGTLASGASASVSWTLIPKPGLGGDIAEGRRYSVYAAISYRQGGRLTSTTTEDAHITIFPEPELFLYYYLPRTVEAGVPFKLGILVENRGAGTARSLRIESGLPRIVENLAGLAISFDILDSSFGSHTASGFTVDFGDVGPGETRVGYWILQTNLDGAFLSFEAELTHEAYKGIDIHPLITGVSSEIIDAEDMAPLEDDPADFYTLVDRDADGFPDYLISLVSGVRVEFRLADQVQVTHPYLEAEPYLGFSVPVSPGLFLTILADPALDRPNVTGVTTGERTLSIRNYFRKEGKLFVLDREGGEYEATFGSGLVFHDLYYTVGESPRSYPYLPDPGRLINFMVEVENRGAVSEAGLLSVYLGGNLVGFLSVPKLLPYEIWENEAYSLFYIIPAEGYSVENPFEVRLPGETRTLQVTVNIPPSGAIELPGDLTVLVPATFKAIDLLDPDGQIVTCYWDFGDTGYEGFHYQALGTEVTYTYLNSGTYTVKMLVKDSNQCTTLVSRDVTVAETRPDLLVSLILTDPETLTEPWTPAEVSFTVTVTNQGVGPTTGSFLVGLYLDGTYLGSVSCTDILEPGASATLEPFTLTLDSLNHVFTARADDNDLICEANESNNALSLMLTIDYPDLTITELTYSLPDGRTDLSYGELISATARITNLSNATGLTFYVVFYLDGEAFASREVAGLASGEEKTISVDFLPLSGVHLLSARVDADLNRVVEENEDNNEAGVTLPEITLLLPDIEILTVSASPSSGPVPAGSPLSLQALIRNSGAGSVLTGFNLSFFLDGAFAGSRRIEALASGATALLTLACPASSGNHTVRVVADEEGMLPETVETNNEASVSFGVLSLLYSDLVISGFTLTPDAVNAGDTVLARISIANLGEAATLAGFDLLITLDGIEVAIAHVGSLQAGSTTTVEQAFTASADEGTHTVTAALDASGLIEERNEANNTASVTLTTTGTWTPPPAVTITLSIEASQAAYSYLDVISLQGDASNASATLSGLLVTVSFASAGACWTAYVQTDDTGHWTLEVPVSDLVTNLLEAGLSGPLSDVTVTASVKYEGTAAQTQATLSITGPDPASPILILSPSELLLGLRPGDFRCIELRIANVGNASVSLTAIKGIALLPWMSVAVPAKMALEPGESITVNLYLAPPSEMTLPHAFSGELKVEGTYGPEGEEQTVTQVLPFTVELSNPDLAYLDFQVFGIGHAFLGGATVTLLDLLSYAVWQTTSVSGGSAYFSDMPCGDYLWIVTSEGYGHSLGKVQAGNLQSGHTIEVDLAPETIDLPEALAAAFTVSASADNCYEREPVLLTLRVSSGITELTDAAASLRVLDASGQDVTGRFEVICLSPIAGTIPQAGYRTLHFLAIPYSNTAGDYTLKALFNYSVEGLVKSTGLTTTLQVRGPPALAITYFIPPTVELGKNYRAGFELTNYGFEVTDLRMDYFYLPLRLSNWSVPASYLLYDGSITLDEGGLSADLGSLESGGSTRGYLHLASSFDTYLDWAYASFSYATPLGVRMPVFGLPLATGFIFKDQVYREEEPDDDPSLISTSWDSLPSFIYSWIDGECVPVEIVLADIEKKPTFVDPTLELTIPEKDAYVLMLVPDFWRGFAMLDLTKTEGTETSTINQLDFWRDDTCVYILDDAYNSYHVLFDNVFRVDEATSGYFAGQAQVASLPYAWMVVTWQELIPQLVLEVSFKNVDIYFAALTHWPMHSDNPYEYEVKWHEFASYHVMCAIVPVLQPEYEMELNCYICQVDSLMGSGAGPNLNHFVVTDNPAIAAGDDGTFVIVFSGYDPGRDPSENHFCGLFWCDPARGYWEYDRFPTTDMVTATAVAWDPEWECYHIAFLADRDEDGTSTLWRYAWKRKSGEIYTGTPITGVSGMSRDAIAVIVTDEPRPNTARAKVLWTYELDGQIILEGMDYLKDDLFRVVVADSGSGREPSVSASLWQTCMVAWHEDGSVHSRMVDLTGLENNPEPILGPDILIGEGSKARLTTYRRGYFALAFQQQGAPWWALYDYLGAPLSGPEPVRSDISGIWPSIAGFDWYKDLVVVWTGWNGTQYSVYIKSVYDDVTCHDIPGWYPGDGHVHSARSSFDQDDQPHWDEYWFDSKYYYSWFDGVYSDQMFHSFVGAKLLALTFDKDGGRKIACGILDRDILGTLIRFPNPPTPYTQSEGAKLMGLTWVIMTDHGPMLGLKSNLVYEEDELGRPAWEWEKEYDCDDLTSAGVFVMICGEELGSAAVNWEGHYLAYGISQYIKGGLLPDGQDPLYYLPGLESIGPNYEYYFLQSLKQQPGAFAYIPHPCGPHNGNKWHTWEIFGFGDRADIWPSELSYEACNVKGLEILTDINQGVKENRELWDYLLSLGCRLFGIANSDGHWSFSELVKAQIGKVGRNRTFVLYDPQSDIDSDGVFGQTDVLHALRTGRTCFSDGIDQMYYVLDLGEGANPRTYEPTDVVLKSTLETRTPTLIVTSTAPIKYLRVYFGKNDFETFYDLVGAIDPVTFCYVYSIGISDLVGRFGAYFRVEARTIGGTRVFAQPIWVESGPRTRLVEDDGLMSGAGTPPGDLVLYIAEISRTATLTGLCVTCTDLIDSNGNVIPAGAVRFEHQTGGIVPGLIRQITIIVDSQGAFADGDYRGTVTAEATTETGEVLTTSIEIVYTIDSIAPDAPVLNQPDAVSIGYAPLEISGTAEPYSWCDILVDGQVSTRTQADPQGMFSAAVSLSRGSHHISAIATDAGGNVSPESEPIAVDSEVDGLPPVCVVDLIGEALPKEGWYSSDVTVVISATDTGEGSCVSRISYSLLGETATLEYTGPITISGEGVHVLVCEAADDSGNVSEMTAVVIGIDADTPQATILSPLDGEETAGDVEIQGTALDSQFAAYELSYSEGVEPVPDAHWIPIAFSRELAADGSLSAVWDTSSVARGLYTIRLVVTDQGGRMSETMVTVVAGVLPRIEAITPPAACIGIVVTLVGSAFGDAGAGSYVSFGQAVASDYVSWTNSEIRVVVPTGVSGQVDVRVTTAAGTSDMRTFLVLPSLDSLDPEIACAGEAVQLVGTGFGPERGESYVTIGDIEVGEYIAWSDTLITVSVPPGISGHQPVVITTEGGASAPIDLTILRRTVLDISQPEAVQYSDTVQVLARLTDELGVGLAGFSVVFTLEGQICVGQTDAEGFAIGVFEVGLPAGVYQVTAFFEGNESFAASGGVVELVVTTEGVLVDYTGDDRVRSGEEFILRASILEEDIASGNISFASVVFEIWDCAEVMVREVEATMIQTTPGHGYAEIVTDPLPAGLYTVRVRLGENDYYSQDQVCSADLVVYDPLSGYVQGAGLCLLGGIRIFDLRVRYPSANSVSPTGHLRLTEVLRHGPPRVIVATDFEYMVIPEDVDIAFLAGACTINGAGGYTFYVEARDRDSRIIGSADELYIRIRDSQGTVVYESTWAVNAGMIRVRHW
ncbi:MAG: CARDB domain-containing protein [Actinomycetota bacterium]